METNDELNFPTVTAPTEEGNSSGHWLCDGLHTGAWSAVGVEMLRRHQSYWTAALFMAKALEVLDTGLDDAEALEVIREINTAEGAMLGAMTSEEREAWGQVFVEIGSGIAKLGPRYDEPR